MIGVGVKNLLWLRFRNREKDCVKIQGENSWDRKEFFMKLCAGRDQIAKKLSISGWRSFEEPMPYYFEKAVKISSGGLVVDVGSNTGFYSLLSASISKKIRVDAYEPMDDIFEIITKNVYVNRLHKRISIYPYAISNKNEDGVLYIPDNGHGLIETSASLSKEFKEKIIGHKNIKKRTLDFLYENGKNISIIKVDAESHDLEVLQGSEKIMMRDRPIIFIEVLLGANETILTDILRRCRYRDYVLFPDGVSLPNNCVKHETLAWNHMWIPEEMRNLSKLGLS
ncbi:FkbM family methyltransferase [Acetobacter pasteurianus]